MAKNSTEKIEKTPVHEILAKFKESSANVLNYEKDVKKSKEKTTEVEAKLNERKEQVDKLDIKIIECTTGNIFYPPLKRHLKPGERIENPPYEWKLLTISPDIQAELFMGKTDVFKLVHALALA